MKQTDPFPVLTTLLSEMQVELSRRAWTEDVFERIDRASDFRGKLWGAISAYVDHHVEIVKGIVK